MDKYIYTVAANNNELFDNKRYFENYEDALQLFNYLVADAKYDKFSGSDMWTRKYFIQDGERQGHLKDNVDDEVWYWNTVKKPFNDIILRRFWIVKKHPDRESKDYNKFERAQQVWYELRKEKVRTSSFYENQSAEVNKKLSQFNLELFLEDDIVPEEV